MKERVRSVPGFVQRRHGPYPCFVVDRLWTVDTCSTAGDVLLERLLGRRAPENTEGTNLLRLLFRPDGLRPHVVNLGQLHRLFVERLETFFPWTRRPTAPSSVGTANKGARIATLSAEAGRGRELRT